MIFGCSGLVLNEYSEGGDAYLYLCKLRILKSLWRMNNVREKIYLCIIFITVNTYNSPLFINISNIIIFRDKYKFYYMFYVKVILYNRKTLNLRITKM